MANAAHSSTPIRIFLTRKSPTSRFTFTSRPPKRFAPRPRRPWVPKFGTRPRASGGGTGPVVRHLPLFQQRSLPCLHLASGKPTVSEQRRQLCPRRDKIRLDFSLGTAPGTLGEAPTQPGAATLGKLCPLAACEAQGIGREAKTPPSKAASRTPACRRRGGKRAVKTCGWKTAWGFGVFFFWPGHQMLWGKGVCSTFGP